MDANVQKCVDKTLVFEGGLSNDPADPGGRTYKGVTQRVYDAYRVEKGLPKQDVALMSNDECYDIYEHQYFIPTFAPSVDDIKCAWKMFDIGVKSKQGFANLHGQRLAPARTPAQHEHRFTRDKTQFLQTLHGDAIDFPATAKNPLHQCMGTVG